MTKRADPRHQTSPIEADDAASGFHCGTRVLDDYFARHALANSQTGVGRCYVLRRSDEDDDALPRVLGFFTLSMALVTSEQAARALAKKLPKYPMPVALVGRLAVDERARGRRLGEALLLDALARVVDAANVIGCIGIIVDAKDEAAEAFYAKYDFITVHADVWPHRMFLPIDVARAVFG